MDSLESHAYIIKGHLLSTAAPEPIMNAIDTLITGLSYKTPEPKVDWDRAQELIENEKQKHLSANYQPQITITTVPDAKPVSIPNAVLHRAIKEASPAFTNRKKRPRKLRLNPEDHLSDIQLDHDNNIPNGLIARKYDVSDQTIVNFLKKHGNYRTKTRWMIHPEKLRQPEPADKGDACTGNAQGSAAAKNSTSCAEPSSPEKPFSSSRTQSARRLEHKIKPKEPAKEDMLGEPLIDAIPKRLLPAYVPQRSPLSKLIPKDQSKQAKWLRDRYQGAVTAGDLMDIHDMLSAGKTLDDIAEHYNTTKKIIETFILDNRDAQMSKCKSGFNPSPIIK